MCECRHFTQRQGLVFLTVAQLSLGLIVFCGFSDDTLYVCSPLNSFQSFFNIRYVL